MLFFSAPCFLALEGFFVVVVFTLCDSTLFVFLLLVLLLLTVRISLRIDTYLILSYNFISCTVGDTFYQLMAEKHNETTTLS